METSLYENIPPELKSYDHWVCGDTEKIPINPKSGDKAKANVPSTWGTFEEAVRHLKEHNNNGIRTIGFEVCITEEDKDPFTIIDIDHCRNVDTGKIEPWAHEIIKTSDSYTEISPSGTGIRIITTCDLPSVNRKKGGLGVDGKGVIEIANHGKYFSVTGNHLEGTPSHIGYRPDEIKAIFEQYFAPKPEPPKEKPSVQSIPDDELIKKAFNSQNGEKFRSLWEGNINGYPSHSEADQALCCILAFWTGNDPLRIDTLFRQSGLMREKWLRDDYRAATINRAIELTTETYKEAESDTSKKSSKAVDEQIKGADLSFPPQVMTGVAGEYAEVYSTYLETPKPFLLMCFFAILGNIVSDRLSIKTELKPQPRGFFLLLGETSEPRKSTSINKTIELFSNVLLREDLNCCWGVGSAEGLQKRLSETKEPHRLVLLFDEFKTFVSKAKIESSILLPCVNTLFESNHYHNTTKKTSLALENVYLSILGASTVATYEKIWDSSFTDIGFNNRLFLVPGKGERKFAIPEKIPEQLKDELKGKIRNILATVGHGHELDLTQDARHMYEDWYMDLERSVHANRLDSYALRFMPLIAVNEGKTIIDVDVVSKTIALMNWQLKVRRMHDPVDADNTLARLEEKIRRILRNSPRSERDLKRYTHCKSDGLWYFRTAMTNLEKEKELQYDKHTRLYTLLEAP